MKLNLGKNVDMWRGYLGSCLWADLGDGLGFDLQNSLWGNIGDNLGHSFWVSLLQSLLERR